MKAIDDDDFNTGPGAELLVSGSRFAYNLGKLAVTIA